jgi:cation transport regulator ChaC
MVATDPQDIFYFAYGSNMDVDRKQDRTGRIREARRARLRRYRLAFNKRAQGGGVYANIVHSDSDDVSGVVYRCDPHAMEALDSYEGVDAGHYQRAPVSILLDNGSSVEAETYVAGERFLCPEGSPPRDYLERMLRGARHHGLPDAYIRRVESARRG